MSDDLNSKATRIEPEVAPSPDSGALSIVPRDLRSTAAPASAENETPVRREPTLNALAVDDNDAERVAFALWREGRADDAIAFLEREILLEKDRLWKRDVLSDRVEPHFGKPAPQVIVTPPPAEAKKTEAKPTRKSRRKRARNEDETQVTEPVFSDASSAPLIELAAETVAIAPSKAVPPFQRMGRGPAIVAALGLIIVGAAYAANLWNERRAAPIETVAPAIAVPPATAVPPLVEATPQDEPQQTASVTPAPLEPEATSEPEAMPFPASDATTEEPLPAPEQGADADEIVTEPTEDVAFAEMPASDASASPPDELDGMTFGPEAPVVVARLPRQRPEPPTDVVYAPPAPQQTPTRRAAVEPLPYDQPAVADNLPRPFYRDDGLPQRDTLTPAEYQALLERRAIAEDYVARRRAVAEQSVPVERRHTILRLLRR